MIDEEIREALDVGPSPEFLARVRTRIATEPAPSAWRWSWTIAAAGALAAAVIVAIALTPGRETAVTPVTQKAEAGPKGPALHQTASVPSATDRRPGPSASARPEGPRASARLAAAPDARRHFGPGESIASSVADPKGPALRESSPAALEVLLDPAETRALHQLIAGVRDGRVDLSAAQNSSSPAPMDLEPVADLVIAPITIEPIAPLSGAEGARP
jgi:hypothetical protein